MFQACVSPLLSMYEIVIRTASEAVSLSRATRRASVALISNMRPVRSKQVLDLAGLAAGHPAHDMNRRRHSVRMDFASAGMATCMTTDKSLAVCIRLLIVATSFFWG